MLDWDKLRIFHAVAEAGSFTHAGESLRLSQSAISRQISALEDSLGTPLFHRHARGLVLTEQGERLYDTVKEINVKLVSTESMIAESKGKPEGPLRITCTTGLGTTWLTPRIREFIERFPQIEVTLLLDDNELDLNMRAADVAIRMQEPTQPDLIRRSLMTMHFHLYASPEYLKKHGIPKSAQDLDKHRIVGFAEQPPSSFGDVHWMLNADPAGQQRLRHLPCRGQRPRPRLPARLHGQRGQEPGAHPAGAPRPLDGGLFRLSGGAAQFGPGRRLPRLPAAPDRHDAVLGRARAALFGHGA